MFLAVKIAAVKRHKVNYGPVVPARAHLIDMNWLPGVVCKTISDVKRDCW